MITKRAENDSKARQRRRRAALLRERLTPRVRDLFLDLMAGREVGTFVESQALKVAELTAFARNRSRIEDVDGQLQARAILSRITDVPEIMKFVSLLLPSDAMARMKILPLSGSARIKSIGFGANAARPFIEERHACWIGSFRSTR